MIINTHKQLFTFNQKNIKQAEEIIARYPDNRKKSAVLPLLDIAQRQNGGWLSINVIEYVANYISEPYIRVYEVASFYSMYNLKPVGKYHIQICRTTPCWLKGAEKIMSSCKKLTKTDSHNVLHNNLFTISEVECLGACINAPVIQINDDYYENLDTKKLDCLIQKLKVANKK